jgi:SPP1 gp7 family putative phage head morphogenesis protein
MKESIDELAEKITKQYLCACCHEAVEGKVSEAIINRISKKGEDEERKRKHDEFFDTLFKATAPHERKFRAMLKTVWDEERKIVLANLKKLKKEWLAKDADDIAESVLYPKARFVGKLSEEAKKIAIMAMAEKGQIELDRLNIDAVFNQEVAHIVDWLSSYFPKFAKEFEAASVDELKKALIEGIKEGETILDLTARVQEVFDDWTRERAYMVARTETIRASNRGSLEAYRQSGVVEKLIWISYLDERCCSWCEDMDGTIVGIDEGFFDLGDEYTIADEKGKDRTMHLDYEAVETPPLHPDCRCSLGPYLEE